MDAYIRLGLASLLALLADGRHRPPTASTTAGTNCNSSRFRMLGRSFPQLTAPAKRPLLRRQPMTPGHGTDRLPARYGLRDNPRLVLVAPLPPTTGSGESFQPPHWLRGSTTHCVHL